MRIHVLRVLILTILLISGLFAQSEYFHKRAHELDGSVLRPEQVLGFMPGEKHATHAALLKYYRQLADQSPRVQLREIGETYENRALILLVISSDNNISTLGTILENNRRLIEKGYAGRQAAGIIESNPDIVWLAAAVHGDETSSPDAVLELSYQLAAGKSAAIDEILNNTVVVIDPFQNPDGRMRTVEYYRHFTSRRNDTYPSAMEHRMSWPGGRGNHYLFDMNRDWFVLTQKESVARVAAYRDFYPHVFVDLHEMGYNMGYYFSPPAQPVNEYIPQLTRDWWPVFGKANAAAFDVNGWQYWSREIFDQYYPGYGEAWPTFAGAVGMTYEQAGSDGMQIRRKDGQVLTFRQSVWQHFTASMSTVITASKNRKAMLKYFYEFYSESRKKYEKSSTKAYIIETSRFPVEAWQLADRLSRLGIRVLQAEAPFRQSVKNRDGKKEKHKFNKGTLIVPLDQPFYFMIRALLDPVQDMGAAFLSEERQRFEQKRRSRIYDVTNWTPLLAYDLHFYSSEEIPEVRSKVFKPDESPVAEEPAEAGFAYLLPYEGKNTLQALVDLLNRECYVTVARESFTIDKTTYPRGSIVVPVHRNKPSIHQQIKRIAETFSCKIESAGSGWTDSGLSLGSSKMQYIKKPRIAVLADMPTSSYSYGAVWYLAEQVYNLEITSIKTMALKNVKLSDFDVIVIPDSRGKYNEIAGKKTLQKLKSWVKDGGVVVGLKRGSRWVAQDSVGLVSVPVGFPKEKKNKDEKKKKKRLIPIQGAYLNADLDRFHYLTLGLDTEMPVFIGGDVFFQPENKGVNVVKFKDPSSLVAGGHLWPEARKQWGGKVYLYNENLGNGQVILFADDPNFRGYQEGTQKLFINALLFAPNMKERRIQR